MQYAFRYPDRIDRLIIASAHPGLSSDEERKRRLEGDAVWAKMLKEGPMEEFLKQWYAQPLFSSYKADFSKRGKQNVAALAESFIHYSLGNQPEYKLDYISIVGQQDAKFRALHPEAIVIEGASHVVHLEKPKEFAKILIERLKL